MTGFRVETDSMGDVQVPSQAYYGAQTQRAVENFPISGWTLPRPLIHAMGRVKYACGVANRDLQKLADGRETDALELESELLLDGGPEIVLLHRIVTLEGDIRATMIITGGNWRLLRRMFSKFLPQAAITEPPRPREATKDSPGSRYDDRCPELFGLAP